jgi:hypothetical protein
MSTCARSGRAPRRTYQRTVYGPGEICQFDLWEPKAEVPVDHGQTRRAWVVTSALGWSRAGAGALIFARQAPDILWGMARCLERLGALPQTVVWDREAAIAPRGRPTDAFAAFCGSLPVGWSICEAADPESKGWVARLSEAKRSGGLEAELRWLGFVPLIVVDEVGYIPFDPEAANLMFSLVAARYERASPIVTSNKPFSAWVEIFGDEVVAAAMIDRLVHHAEILGLKGDSYRLRDKDLGSPPPRDRARPACSTSPYGLASAGRSFTAYHTPEGGQFQTGRKGSDFDRR